MLEIGLNGNYVLYYELPIFSHSTAYNPQNTTLYIRNTVLTLSLKINNKM